MHNLLIAYYGDDFTGSTDALEFLSRAGVKTVLFIDVPSKEQLAKYEGLQALGIAGMSRAMPPEKMEEELIPVFAALKDLNPRHIHYKVCSTFDSSPEIGSIGKAIDIGMEIFESTFVPLLVAAPVLGRYCLFGNLFARMGIGSAGSIYRLDRHPSMSKHPVTPARESDLRIHLNQQTSKKIGLVDILQLEKDVTETFSYINKQVRAGTEVILFDALNQEQLSLIGNLIEIQADVEKPLFSVGSSGIEMALGEFWDKAEVVGFQPDWVPAGNAEPILVASGSCSPVTSEQISYALTNGFMEIAIDTEELALNGISTEVIERYAGQAAEYLRQKLNVIVHTSTGNDDERVRQTEKIFKEMDIDKTETAILYGTVLGEIAKRAAEKAALQRIVIAGGDTSSYAARAMGIEAVEMIAPLSPGAPLCKAYAPGSSIDGREVNFKGGQVGKQDYFVMAARGIEETRIDADYTT